MYFGVDIQAEVSQWWESDFAAVVAKKYPGASFVVTVLDPAAEPAWTSPETGAILVRLTSGPPDEEDLLENVHHKLRFVLRTGLDSSRAQSNLHLVEPGDFPHGGAVRYRGLAGGASGLVEESDVWVTQKVIDRVVAVREDSARRALQASLAHLDGWKFLPDQLPPAPATAG